MRSERAIKSKIKQLYQSFLEMDPRYPMTLREVRTRIRVLKWVLGSPWQSKIELKNHGARLPK